MSQSTVRKKFHAKPQRRQDKANIRSNSQKVTTVAKYRREDLSPITLHPHPLHLCARFSGSLFGRCEYETGFLGDDAWRSFAVASFSPDPSSRNRQSVEPGDSKTTCGGFASRTKPPSSRLMIAATAILAGANWQRLIKQILKRLCRWA
jgi:hypothetical protein